MVFSKVIINDDNEMNTEHNSEKNVEDIHGLGVFKYL